MLESSESPEHLQPTFGGFWVRVAADLIDSAVMNVGALAIEATLFGMLYAIVMLIGPESFLGASLSQLFTPFSYQVVFFSLRVGMSFGYYTWGHFHYGTTLGKSLFQLYVLAAVSHRRITLLQSVLRSLNYALSLLPLGGGFLLAGVHPRKQALHDILADTVVLRLPKGKSALDLFGFR